MLDSLEDYIEEHISPEPAHLKKIDRLTNIRYINGRMCSGHTQGRLLKMFTAMINPEHVLEIGSFSGYSALCIAEALKDGATLDTIEIDDELEEFLIENFKESGLNDKITLHIGDALEVIDIFPDNYFDMAFIDGDKRIYCNYYEKVMPKMRQNSFILVDNTLWDGHVIEDMRHSSQTKGVIEFNEMVKKDNRVEVAIVPVRDGLTILRKIT